jgi:hypothetical protein
MALPPMTDTTQHVFLGKGVLLHTCMCKHRCAHMCLCEGPEGSCDAGNTALQAPRPATPPVTLAELEDCGKSRDQTQ